MSYIHGKNYMEGKNMDEVTLKKIEILMERTNLSL